MIFIFEGPDRVGKDTQIKMLRPYLTDMAQITIHATNIGHLDPTADQKAYAQAQIVGQFAVMNLTYLFAHLIFNRSYLGEHVYGRMYRGYDTSFVFEIEQKQQDLRFFQEICLIVLTDSVENLTKRDDGESMSSNHSRVAEELAGFNEVFSRSCIQNKFWINCKDRSPRDVHQAIMNDLRNAGIKFRPTIPVKGLD